MKSRLLAPAGALLTLVTLGGCKFSVEGVKLPPSLDSAWCDVSAVNCAVWKSDQNGTPTLCLEIDNPTEVPQCDANGCGPVCFDHATVMPEHACDPLCDQLNEVLHPGSHSGQCHTSLNMNGATHPATGWKEGGCVGTKTMSLTSDAPPLAGKSQEAPDFAAALAGVATISIDGHDQDITIKGGELSLASPDISCGARDNPDHFEHCDVRINRLAVLFDDFQFGDAHIKDLQLDTFRVQPVMDAARAASETRVSFAVPVATAFNASGQIGDQKGGLLANTTAETFGTFDPTTGSIGLTISTTATLDDKTFVITGTVHGTAMLNRAPIAQAGPDQAVNATSGCSAPVSLDGSGSSDPDGETPLLSWREGAQSLGHGTQVVASLAVGQHDIVLGAVDGAGAGSEDTVKVSVVDRAPPEFSFVPPPLTVPRCQTHDIGQAAAFDGCGGPVTLGNDQPASFPRTGSTTVTWTATDGNGNSASAAEVVTVQDSTPPVFLSVPPPITVNACGPVPLGGPAQAGDDCGGPVAIANNAPAFFGPGVTPVTWTATDLDGNAATATQLVTVADTTPPVFTFVPPAVTITQCTSAPIGHATATDPCGVTIGNNAPAKFPLGTTLVTWTATDGAGNKTTATQLVTAVLADDASCCPTGTNIIVGTSGADTLLGTEGSDCILGRGGNDTIDGRGGNDFISGGAGNDTINGGFGNDLINGGDGDDVIDGGPGDDTIDGGPGFDTCAGSTGTNAISRCELVSGG
jgi:Ca2+-binding RTX toxin-like protein